MARTGLLNFSARAAIAFEKSVARTLNMLRTFPAIGRLGHIPNTRELVSHKRYRLIYRLKEREVTIIKLHNVSRPWPPKNHYLHD